VFVDFQYVDHSNVCQKVPEILFQVLLVVVVACQWLHFTGKL